MLWKYFITILSYFIFVLLYTKDVTQCNLINSNRWITVEQRPERQKNEKNVIEWKLWNKFWVYRTKYRNRVIIETEGNKKKLTLVIVTIFGIQYWTIGVKGESYGEMKH